MDILTSCENNMNYSEEGADGNDEQDSNDFNNSMERTTDVSFLVYFIILILKKFPKFFN